MSDSPSAQNGKHRNRDRGQLVAVVGIVVSALLAIFSFAEFNRFLICMSCGFLVLGGYMIRCPARDFSRTAEAYRIGIIAATIIVPTLVLTSGRMVDEMPRFIETVVEELFEKATLLDWEQATLIDRQEGPSSIVRWAPNKKKVAVMKTETLGLRLSELADSTLQFILWVIVIGILLVLSGLFIGNQLAIIIEKNMPKSSDIPPPPNQRDPNG